jgi:hypothetical protein
MERMSVNFGVIHFPFYEEKDVIFVHGNVIERICAKLRQIREGSGESVASRPPEENGENRLCHRKL